MVCTAVTNQRSCGFPTRISRRASGARLRKSTSILQWQKCCGKCRSWAPCNARPLSLFDPNQTQQVASATQGTFQKQKQKLWYGSDHNTLPPKHQCKEAGPMPTEWNPSGVYERRPKLACKVQHVWLIRRVTLAPGWPPSQEPRDRYKQSIAEQAQLPERHANNKNNG